MKRDMFRNSSNGGREGVGTDVASSIWVGSVEAEWFNVYKGFQGGRGSDSGEPLPKYTPALCDPVWYSL